MVLFAMKITPSLCNFCRGGCPTCILMGKMDRILFNHHHKITGNLVFGFLNYYSMNSYESVMEKMVLMLV